MKNIKSFEQLNELNDEDYIKSLIYDNISSEIYLRDVPYSMEEGAKEVDPDSIEDAVSEVMKTINKYYILKN